MKTVNGIYTSAKIFADTVEEYAVAQLQMLCNHKAFEGCKIRVMPDVHPGKVGTIGFTSTVGAQVLPNVIGIDIGCGITMAKLKQKKVEFQKLDKVIREEVPSGFQIRNREHRFAEEYDFSRLYCEKAINKQKARMSIGTLGGGNHFLELDKDEEGALYLVVHTGSRHLGKEVTEYYLNEGQKQLKQQGVDVPYELTYLQGTLMEEYLHDLQVVCEFADLNRQAILDTILKGMKWKSEEIYSVIHNYVGRDGIIRKGAISAHEGEKVIIPINMRDGMILGHGIGNAEWNNSAPHGSGRLMKRESVKEQYTVSQFKAVMKGIYCSCIGKETLDEAPFAYRGLKDIEEAIRETVVIEKIISPIYNFKAGEERR